MAERTVDLGAVGLAHKGPYDAGTVYNKNDLVGYQDQTWTPAHDGVQGIEPAAGPDWYLYAGDASLPAAAAHQSAQDAAEAAAAAEKERQAADLSAETAAEQAQAAGQYAEAAKESEQAAAEHAAQTGKDVQAVQGYADAAAGSAAAAGVSETNAEKYAKQAQSYAVGGTETRPNEETQNTEYFYNQVKRMVEAVQGALMPMGTISFAELATVSPEPSHMYNISDAFETDDRFKEGPGHKYPAGTNVYYTADGHWDAMSGAYVLGVKGEAEKEYRLGQVNITPENIGALPATGKAVSAITADKVASTLTFTGHSTGTFDGSKPLTIDIPAIPGTATESSGGLLSAEDKKKIDSIDTKQDTLTGAVGQAVGFDADGNAQAVDIGGRNLILDNMK